MAAPQPRLHDRRDCVARHRHRLQLGALHDRRRGALPAAPVRAVRSPRQRLRQRRRRRCLRHQLLSRLPRFQGEEPGLHGSGRLQCVDRGGEGGRAVAARHRGGRDRQLLPDARAEGDDRPHAAAGGRSARRAARGRHLGQGLAARLRVQPGGARPDDAHPRPAVHDRRRAAAVVHRHAADPAARGVDGGGVGRGNPAGGHPGQRPVARQHAARAARPALDVSRRPAQGRRDARARAGEPAGRDAAARHAVSRSGQGQDDRDRADQSGAGPSGSGPHAGAGRGGTHARRRPRVAHRVRERREHAARARLRPAEGDRHPPRDRREPPPARSATAHREPGAVGARRGGRHRRWRGW